MFPSFVLFGRTISMYSVCAIVGILAIIFATYRLAKKKGLDEVKMLFLVMCTLIGAFIISHIFYSFTRFDVLTEYFSGSESIKSFSDFWNFIGLFYGGSVYYGGLVGIIVATIIYTKARKLNFGEYSDIVAVGIPLFHFFGRIGCFLAGCCYGVEWEHGVTYHNAIVEEANGVARLPVQLIESGLNLLLFLFLLYLCLKSKCKDRLLPIYLIVYPTYRFILEFFRGDSYRGFLFGLSTSQLISIILLAIAIPWMIIKTVKQKKAGGDGQELTA